jgi:hypothetical protein
MPKKKVERATPRSKAVEPHVAAKLSQAEQDLLRHMHEGYQLETDSLGGNPVLRRAKGNEVVRLASVNRSTVQALAARGLISEKPGHRLTMVWHITQKKSH